MLGVQLTMDKHQGCTQTMEYLGCLFDISCGLMQCTEEKLVLLLTHTAVFSSQIWPGPRATSIAFRVASCTTQPRFGTCTFG
jgi:hypothetical protein